MLENLWMGIQGACTPFNLVCCLLATIEGIIVGALPGLGPTIGMSLLIPFTCSSTIATGRVAQLSKKKLYR